MKKLIILFMFINCQFVHAATTGTNAGVGTISYNVGGFGTCGMSFTPANGLVLPSTNAKEIIDTASPAILSIEKLTITFTDCSGTAESEAPFITVSGTTSTDNSVIDNRQYLLKSGGSSQGFGFVMGKSDQGTMTWGNGTDGIYSFLAQPVEVSLGNTGTTITNGITKDIYFGLSCGTAESCRSQNIKAGKLESNIIFNFLYK